jgi:hypothetical protein
MRPLVISKASRYRVGELVCTEMREAAVRREHQDREFWGQMQQML